MTLDLTLPGFRFHPTEEELLTFYLKNTISGKNPHYNIIGLTNIYRYHPDELPGMAKIGEREWYFFVPRDKKQRNGGLAGRPNRTTSSGYWKATGSDRKITSLSDPKRFIGLKKTLVFYQGRAPKGIKTDWIMNEYRLPQSTSSLLPKEDIVLCKLYRKATPLKVLEMRATTMEEINKSTSLSPSSNLEPLSPQRAENQMFNEELHEFVMEKENEEEIPIDMEMELNNGAGKGSSSATTIRLPTGSDMVPELQISGKLATDWMQDPFWNQMGSPWFLNLTPNASILNF